MELWSRYWKIVLIQIRRNCKPYSVLMRVSLISNLSGLQSLKMSKFVEWFSRMKNVNVLYLGRWKSSEQHHIVREFSLENHIEVESTEFLKGLKIMKFWRLLCLQGISRIEEFPSSIGKITNLRILDLKACHNLEALPDGTALLKKLSHLDISECYLSCKPKEMASLSSLWN